MTDRRPVPNPLALAVLAFLLMGPMHPYELGRRLQETEKDKNFKYNRGSLYMVVKQLAKAGLVAERETVRDTERPERTVYALTDAGRGELYDWLRELVSTPKEEYPHFGMALSLLSVLPPAETVDLLAARAAALTVRAAAVRSAVRAATDGGLDWVFVVEDEYELALVEAELRFVDRLVAYLRRPDYEKEWKAMTEHLGETT